MAAAGCVVPEVVSPESQSFGVMDRPRILLNCAVLQAALYGYFFEAHLKLPSYQLRNLNDLGDMSNHAIDRTRSTK